MSIEPISIGKTFHKTGQPKIIWTVDRFKPGDGISHVVLRRADDPTTQIIISARALSDRLLFRHAVLAEEMAT
jgi:hypothetical protein